MGLVIGTEEFLVTAIIRLPVLISIYIKYRANQLLLNEIIVIVKKP